MVQTLNCCQWTCCQSNQGELQSLVADTVPNTSSFNENPENDAGDDENPSCLNLKASAVAGVILAFLGGCFFGVSNIFVLLCNLHGSISPAQQLLVKSIFMVCIIIPVLFYHHINPFKAKRNSLIFYIGRSCMENISDMTVYYAFILAGLGESTAIAAGTNPVLTYVLACVFLREKCDIADILAVVANVTGIFLVFEPQLRFGSHISGYGLAVLTGVLMSTGALWARKIRDDMSVLVLLFYNGITGIVIFLPMIFFTSETSILASFKSNPSNIGYVFGMVAFFVMSIGAYYTSLTLEMAGKVTVLGNSQIVIGFIANIAIFHLKSNVLSLVGAGLILFSSIALMVWRKYCNGEENEESEEIDNRFIPLQ
ncbi:solute carrier family 35 member G1-like [Glandiceps talaboti]